MGSGLRSRGKKDAYKMPLYTTSIEEEKWHKYCMDNNIRISPIGIFKEPGQWKIGINIGKYNQFVGSWSDAQNSWYWEQVDSNISTEPRLSTPLKDHYIAMFPDCE